MRFCQSIMQKYWSSPRQWGRGVERDSEPFVAGDHPVDDLVFQVAQLDQES